MAWLKLTLIRSWNKLKLSRRSLTRLQIAWRHFPLQIILLKSSFLQYYQQTDVKRFSHHCLTHCSYQCKRQPPSSFSRNLYSVYIYTFWASVNVKADPLLYYSVQSIRMSFGICNTVGISCNDVEIENATKELPCFAYPARIMHAWIYADKD